MVQHIAYGHSSHPARRVVEQGPELRLISKPHEGLSRRESATYRTRCEDAVQPIQVVLDRQLTEPLDRGAIRIAFFELSQIQGTRIDPDLYQAPLSGSPNLCERIEHQLAKRVDVIL